jgi:16S rRNA (adenine1518-N6/adenine1519-N6)-dimethyltransferase
MTARVKLVANLPYDVGTAMVIAWLRACASEPRLGEAIVMLQAEVGARLAARPGTKEYGALGALAQSTHSVERVADVSPSCFSPAPKVWSRVVRLSRRATPAFPLERWEPHAEFLHAAFAHRRKQLAVSLAGARGLGRDAWREALLAIGHREEARAEDLSPEDLAALAANVG